ncbi:hypothetical protein D3C71_499510 [compost metagenome]
MLNVPSGATVPVPTTWPVALVTVTVEPGSPPPPISVPELLTTRLVGGSGPVRSGEATVPGSDSLPASSVRVTFRSPPSA